MVIIQPPHPMGPRRFEPIRALQHPHHRDVPPKHPRYNKLVRQARVGEQTEFPETEDPAEPVELHAAAVVDARAVSPHLGEVDADFRDEGGREPEGDEVRFVQGCRGFANFVVEVAERRVSETRCCVRDRRSVFGDGLDFVPDLEERLYDL
jgi:hypothetical protein